MTSREEAVSKLVVELNKRKKYLQQIKKLAQQQSFALEKDDPEEIFSVLNARECIIEEVDALDAEDGRAAEFLKSAVGDGKFQAAATQEALDIVMEIENLIGEIQSIDSENLIVAKKIRGDLGRRLQDISNHRKSQKLYKGEGKRISGAFLNKRG